MLLEMINVECESVEIVVRDIFERSYSLGGVFGLIQINGISMWSLLVLVHWYFKHVKYH